jgi:hypothetical protein
VNRIKISISKSYHTAVVISCFLILFLLSGCCSVNESIGLKASWLRRQGKDCLEVWLPFYFPNDYMAKDFMYFRREIPYSKNTEENVRNALNELLKGPTEAEKQKGAYALVNESRILDLKIKKSRVRINFSKEFAPPGGSHAIWQCNIAVEEVLRQFPGIKKVEISVEGIPASESLQP